MKDWRFLDELRRETERSLAREPERQPWGRKVEEVVEDQPMVTRHRDSGKTADRRHRTGKGHVEGGQSGERTRWTQRQYDAARRDLERQQQEAQEERQALREQAAREVRERVREANDAVRRGDPPPGWRR